MSRPQDRSPRDLVVGKDVGSPGAAPTSISRRFGFQTGEHCFPARWGRHWGEAFGAGWGKRRAPEPGKRGQGGHRRSPAHRHCPHPKPPSRAPKSSEFGPRPGHLARPSGLASLRPRAPGVGQSTGADPWGLDPGQNYRLGREPQAPGPCFLDIL